MWSLVLATIQFSLLAATQELLKYDTIEAAVSEITNMASSDTRKTEFYVLVDDKVYGILDFDAKYSRYPGSYEQGNLMSVSWTQYRVHNQEPKMTPWSAASCVHSNEHGSLPFTITTTGVSAKGHGKPGFNVKFGNLAAQHAGYATEDDSPVSRTYSVPAYKFAQAWQQSLVVRQDQQHVTCERDGGDSPIKCGSWSESVSGDLPVANGVSFGWRTVYESLDLKSCGEGITF